MPGERVQFVGFNIWKPDGSIFGPEMEVAKNVLPAYGSWRGISKAAIISSLTSSVPPTGAYSHVFQRTRSVQYLRATSQQSRDAASWINPSDNTTTNLHNQLDDELALDHKRISCGLGSALEIVFRVKTPLAPQAGVAGKVRVRYRVIGFGGAVTSPSWSLKTTITAPGNFGMSLMPPRLRSSFSRERSS